MSSIDRALRGLALAAAIIGSGATLAMTVLITWEVFQRAVLGRSFMFVEEYAGYMVLVVLAFGVPLALMDDALLRVDLIIDNLKRDTRRRLQVIYDLLSLVFCCTLTYYLTLFAYRSFTRGIFAPTPMMTPIYIPQSLIAFGFAVLSLCLLWRVVAGLMGEPPHTGDRLEGAGEP